ncbi:MAG: hypothetical protein D9N11_09620 [Ketobacter sp.]|nr:MAG: hypothetical protein D9N11_09620 [Ketobacter sp.]
MNQQHRLALPTGNTIHWYEIESVLGKGGFGITYLARDKNLDKAVAIKEFLPTEFATRDPDYTVHPDSAQNEELFRWGLTRFIEEARVLSRFEHPNIVRVFTVFEENNTGYMVMAYEHGRSLKAILNEQNTLSEERLMKLLLPILDGLQLVHGKQFIHRDIKPDNIYVREDGTPVLLDFGSARQAIEGESRTMTTMVSPGYAPFEQYHAKGEEQGPWTDIYSLGATAFRAISGVNPIDAVTRSRALLEGKPDPQPLLTPENHPGYSPALLAAVNHALCFRMADRPQNLQQWIQELQGDDGATVLVDHTELSPLTAVTKADVASGKASVAESKQGNMRRVISAAVVLLVCLTAGFGVFHWSQPGAPDQTQTEQAQPEQSSPQQPDAEQVKLERTEAQRQQEMQARQEEESRLAEQRRKEEEARKAEAARQAEATRRQELEAEQARLKEAQRQQELARQELARKQALEKARLQAQQEMETRIALSRQEFEKRQGTKIDPYGINEYPVAKPLNSNVTIKVPAATKAWTSSGVMIERGKTYSISASGTWSVGKLCKPTDASGEGVYTLSCWDIGGRVVEGFSHSALVGKIGKGTFPFYVGNSFSFTAERDGALYFMVNDSAATFNDNSGALDVTITRQN